MEKTLEQLNAEILSAIDTLSDTRRMLIAMAKECNELKRTKSENDVGEEA